MTEDPGAIGIIGGSGVETLFEGGPIRIHRVGTPWGAPSGPVLEGDVSGTRVFFLARHGEGHTIPPHRVNYRANIDALRTLGVRSIVAMNSVGSLKEELPPGTFVLPDQFVDQTKQRPNTFFNEGRAVHVSLADPFCPRMMAAVADAGRSQGSPFVEQRTYVCVEGPRFSTRAESRWFRSFADVIGMTLLPEAALARERALCYVCLAMVTDFDVWAERPVEAKEIADTMRRNSEKVRRVLTALVPRIAGPRSCSCSRALESAGL